MKLIKPFLETRTKLLQIFIIAVITTFGLNLITTSIFEIFNFKGRESYLLWIGIVFVLFGVLYLLGRLIHKPKINRSIEGFLLFDKKTKLPVNCEGYEYLEALHDNFRASFSESKAMKHIWKDKSFGHEKGNALIIEASEYFLLDQLSLHLADYFKDRNLDSTQLVNLTRNKIDDILLSNRFLELFSKPMEHRASFVKDTKKERESLRMGEDGIILSEFEKGIKNDRKKGRVIRRMGKGGAIFSEFYLVLPKDSEVTRKDNSIQIDTKRFKMNFKFNYDGFGYVLPDWFEELYCGFKKYDDSLATEIRLDISIEFKHLTLFSKGGWDYYEWIELFLGKMNESFSGDYFFKKINWNQAYTQAIINQNIIRRKAKSKKS